TRQQPLVRPRTAPESTAHSLKAAGSEEEAPQHDVLIEVAEGNAAGQDLQDDDVKPYLENLQESCVSALLKLFPPMEIDTLQPPMFPTVVSLRRHSEPMANPAGPSSAPLLDASDNQTPLHQLLNSLRRRDPLSPVTSDETALQEIERRLPEVASASLHGPLVALANALVSLLVNIQKLSDLEAPPGTTSRPSTSQRSSFNSKEAGKDMYATLGEQLLKARHLHRSRSMVDVGLRPAAEALWSRIDGGMEIILRLCREGTPSYGLTPDQQSADNMTPGSFKEPTRPTDYFDHLPPEYQDDDESPAYELPGYDRLDEYSGRLMDKKKEKEALDEDSDSEHPKLSEKMRMDLESVASAIDRLYQVAPQLHNQRVELKRSKLAEMELARLRGGHSRQRNSTSESALESETEKLVGRGRIVNQTAEPSKRFSAESLSRRLDPKGKGKAREEDSFETQSKKKEDLDRILSLIGKSSGEQRRIVDQRVDARDFQAKVERAKVRDDNQREQLVDRLVKHSNAGRFNNQDAMFVRASLRPPGPKEFLPQEPEPLLSLPEFMEEALPPASLSRTLNPNALLTLPEFFEEQRREMELEAVDLQRKQKESRRKSSASARSVVAGPSTNRIVLAPPVSSPNPVTLLKKLTRSRSNSAPPLNFAWFKHSSSSSSYKTAERSLPMTRESSGLTQKSENEEDSGRVVYVAEFQKNIHSMQVYLRYASGEPKGHVEFEVLPTKDGTLTGSHRFVIRNGGLESPALPLPAPANVGHHEVKVVKGHLEIKLDIPALAEIPSEPEDDLSRLMPADELKSLQPTSFVCTSCSLPLVQCGKIRDYRDLPSEHWEEFVEAWMCHQDQKLTEHIGKHRQGVFVPDRGVAFVGGSYVLFDDEMVVGENVNTSPSSQHLNGEARLSFRLAKYALRPTRPNLELPKIPLSAFVVADMLELRQVHAAHRFIVRDEEEDNARMLIWLFNPSITVSYQSITHYALPNQPTTRAAKVFYTVIKPGSTMSLNQKSIVEKHPSFAQSEILSYPIAICRSLATLLRESNETYPPARRSMIGLDVGWLQRV
ncbi:hypothetical protein FRB90_012485, partial [Tulasnella sp. 427]